MINRNVNYVKYSLANASIRMMTFSIIPPPSPQRREDVESQMELFLLHATVDRNFLIVAIYVLDAILVTVRRRSVRRRMETWKGEQVAQVGSTAGINESRLTDRRSAIASLNAGSNALYQMECQ